jgi:hypothetical protein
VVGIRVERNDYPVRQQQWHRFFIREFTTRLCYASEVFMAEPIFSLGRAVVGLGDRLAMNAE